jgi:hypothetical protein
MRFFFFSFHFSYFWKITLEATFFSCSHLYYYWRMYLKLVNTMPQKILNSNMWYPGKELRPDPLFFHSPSKSIIVRYFYFFSITRNFLTISKSPIGLIRERICRTCCIIFVSFLLHIFVCLTEKSFPIPNRFLEYFSSAQSIR